MDSSDYQKTEIELFRDARVAELALHIQPSMAPKKAIKRKRKQHSQMPTRKSNRNKVGGGSDEDFLPEEAKTSASNTEEESEEEGSAEEQFEEIVHDVGETSHGGQRMKQTAPMSVQGGFGGFGSPASQPSATGQWVWQQNSSGQWQWVWVASQPMPPPPPPPPTQPPPWYSASAYSPSLPRSESVDRSNRRQKQKELEKKSVVRTASGKKPSFVHVTEDGEIDAASSGKNAWDQAMRAYVPITLDLSVIDWKQHKPHTLQKLRDTLNSEFEYLGHPLSNRGFCTAVKKFLKCERSRLKRIFLQQLENNEEKEEDDKDCPIYIDVNQWKKLKTYWSQDEQVQKSEMMSNVRKQVQNVSKHGRRGKANEVATVMKDNKGLIEITDVVQSSEAGGSSVVSPGVYVQQDEFDKFRLETLASTNRNTKALETLEAAIMKFLHQDKNTNVVSDDVYDFTFPNLELEGCPQSIVEPLEPVKEPMKEKKPVEPMKEPVEPVKEKEPVESVEPMKEKEPVESVKEKEPVELVKEKEPVESVKEKEPMKEPVIVKDGAVNKPEDEAKDAVEDKPQEIEDLEAQSMDVPHDGPTVVYEFVRRPKDVEDPVVVKQLKKIGSEGGSFSMQLRRNNDRQVQHTEEAKTKALITEEAKVQPTPKMKAKKQPTQSRAKVQKDKFSIGDRVSLLNPASPKEVVAAGTVTSVGGGPGPQQYHGRPLPLGWYRLDVEMAPGGFTNLMHPNPDADEFQLKDVVGGNTIWNPTYMIPIVRCVGKPPMLKKGKIVE